MAFTSPLLSAAPHPMLMLHILCALSGASSSCCSSSSDLFSPAGTGASTGAAVDDDAPGVVQSSSWSSLSASMRYHLGFLSSTSSAPLFDAFPLPSCLIRTFLLAFLLSSSFSLFAAFSLSSPSPSGFTRELGVGAPSSDSGPATIFASAVSVAAVSAASLLAAFAVSSSFSFLSASSRAS